MGGAGRAGAVTEWAVGGALLGLTAAVVQLLGRGLAARNARATRRMQRRRGLARAASQKHLLVKILPSFFLASKFIAQL